MFNITNAAEYEANPSKVKPILQQIGPYVFEEVRERVGIVFHSDVVSFNQTRMWHFKPELSPGLSLNDRITNINTVSATINYNVRFYSKLIKMGFYEILDVMGSLTTSKTVRQLLFDGYDDNELDWLVKMKKLFPSLPSIPLTKFGWFVQRNLSAEHDGRMVMATGRNNIFNVGMLYSWNGANHTKFFRDECSRVNGTTGELWPPIKGDPNRPLTMFIVDVCRYLLLQPEKNVTKYGVDGIQWSGDAAMLDGQDANGTATCWCLANKCPDLKPGVFNASTCQFGAPAFMSYPHFYLADPSYREAVVGMKPNASEHKFYVSLAPDTGIPLEIRGRLQVNLLVRNEPASRLYKNVPDTFMPMFWFTQSAAITQELADKTKTINKVKEAGLWASLGLAIFGTVFSVVGIWLMMRQSSDDEFDDSSDSRPILDDASVEVSQQT